MEIAGRLHLMGGFDLESYGSLNALWGEPLCISFKPLGKPPITISMLDYETPVEWASRTQDTFNQFWYLFGWNSSAYDLKFIRTVFSRLGLPPKAFFFHTDLIKIARKYYRMTNNKLDTWAGQFSEYKKTLVTPELWQPAAKGNKESMKHVIKHCETDLRIQEDIFNKARFLEHINRWDKEIL